ncbi:protein TANC2 isoform X2 [Athalia rosae]|uniref:protein TANC2 isoform X2 n=1 Tax=Athalia rosae TaxID=37344 RepID=UPI00203387F3|nr:protein TANC2 isoform X2 [Athalia rosae]
MAPPDRHRTARPGSGLSLSVLDLAQIKALVESSSGIGGSICPSCEMPFDKGKKRRLIDDCGHERCYSCTFRSETCPLCAVQDSRRPGAFQSTLERTNRTIFDRGSTSQLCTRPCSREQTPISATSARARTREDVEEWIEDTTAVNVLCGGHRTRVKIDENLTPFVQSHADVTSPLPTKGPKGLKGKPPRTPTDILSRCCSPNPQQKANMSQSCPTPPQHRRRFFLSPKVLRSPFGQKNSSAHQRAATPELSNDNPSALSAWMTSSWEGKSRWPGLVLGKIKSLWSSSEGTTSDGLNQLISSTEKNTDDEGANVRPLSSRTKKCLQSDLYMRLGLLLGGNSRSVVGNGSCPRSSTRLGESQSRESSAASFSSLTSFETQTLASTNTSPVSTLNGTSSEAEVAIVHRGGKDCDSVASLISMSISGLSNGSSSPLTPRRHSVTTTQPGKIEELGVFKTRRTCVRRSGRSGIIKESTDPRIHFAQYRSVQLTLKPLFFEVPLLEADPIFTGRQWLVDELDTVVSGSSSGVLISGSPGTGKTALILQLVEHSCFGRRREQIPPPEDYADIEDRGKSSSPLIQVSMQNTNDKIRELASHVVAYHFCQADNNNTCLVPDLIHSLAAQLCQAPQLVAYREYLLSEPHLQGSVSQRECTVDPDLALTRGIIEPMVTLHKADRLPCTNMIILIDAICEAEYHRPDRGDTIASFLARHASNLPSWLKIICTVRTQLEDCAKQFPFARISLDKSTVHPKSSDITRDLTDYVTYRLSQSPSIQANVSGANQTRFTSHLLTLSKGNFLFAKLTLDLIESGHLVAKSASYKVLPVSLAQIFLLHFNLRFPTATSFDRVQPLLGVCLAALYPLTLLEIFYSVNALNIDHFVSWQDFLQRFKMLSGFLVKRLDNTYMFFHPSFREWLIRRDEGESTKFLCDLRLGHAAIAFRLSRLQAPLDGDKVLELGHHVLKAHVYRGVAPSWPSRDLQASWLTSSTESVSSALCTLRNIYSPNVKVSRLLLLAGASPNHVTEYLGSAPVLCMHAHEGSVEMISLLLEFGADVELTNSQGCTALSLAAARGHCDVVRRLAAAGASLGHADMAGQCPLVHAARHARLSVVGYLLACDWLVKVARGTVDSEVGRAEAAQQAVVAAAAQGHEQIVEYLLDMAEVKVDCPDSLTGETALTTAAAHGSTAVVCALLARGANPAAVNAKGFSPLMLAARDGHWGAAERLLEGSLSSSTDQILDQAKPLLNQRDLVGRTALMVAAAEGHCNLAELFLDNGAMLEATDNEGLTAVGWACVRGRISAVQSLLDHGANINTTDKTGRTPLDLAAFQGNPKLVQLLLDRGAAVEHVDLHGMRPLDRAIGCRNIPVVQCFLRRGAKLGPATWAMAAGKPDILLILLNKLLEDGNVLYRKGRLKEASHRYGYALRKFPSTSIQSLNQDQEPKEQERDKDHLLLHLPTFTQLRLNFLLNLSRCKRKMNEVQEAIELASEVLKTKPDSYEAFYARAKANVDARHFEDALSDVKEALHIAPPHNREVRRVLSTLKDEICSRNDGAGSSRDKPDNGFGFHVSMDTLTEL